MPNVAIRFKVEDGGPHTAEAAASAYRAALAREGIALGLSSLALHPDGCWAYTVEVPRAHMARVIPAVDEANARLAAEGAPVGFAGTAPDLSHMRRTVVVNMFGGPGAGKTTAAHEITAALKKEGFVVEFVPEYAKELCWTRNDPHAPEDERRRAETLLNGRLMNQQAIWQEQNRRVESLVGRCDFVVTDSPALLSCMYVRDYRDAPGARKGLAGAVELFKRRWLSSFAAQDNFNLIVERSGPYRQEGRMHTEEQARGVDEATKRYLAENGIPFQAYGHGDAERAVEEIKAARGRLCSNMPAREGARETAENAIGKDGETMEEQATRGSFAGEGGFEREIPVKIPSKWVRRPFAAKSYKTGEPVVSRNGNQLWKAYVKIPENVKVGGESIGGYSMVVDYAWGERAKSYMDAIAARGDSMVFDLARSADREGRVYLHPPIDADGNSIGEPLRIDARRVAGAVRADREAYTRASQGQAAPKPARPRQATPAGDAAMARQMAGVSSNNAHGRAARAAG